MLKTLGSSLFTAAISGFVAVFAAAYGAHVLSDHATPTQMAQWETGVKMNLVHAAAMLATVALRAAIDPTGVPAQRLKWGFRFLLAGTTLFCGSVYAMCLGVSPKTMGPMAPAGGISLMLGWIIVACAGL